MAIDYLVYALESVKIHLAHRGKSHLFDSEVPSKTYKKNIDRDIAKAYKLALQYVIDRVRSLCESRGANYVFVDAEASLGEIFFEELVNMEVLK